MRSENTLLLEERKSGDPYLADIAWAAGFFDGEGCVMLNAPRTKYGKRRSYPNIQTAVAQIYPLPLDELAALFGGCVTKRNTKTFRANPLWRWQVSGYNAERFLRMIYPYTRRKHQVIAHAVAFMDAYHNCPYSQEWIRHHLQVNRDLKRVSPCTPDHPDIGPCGISYVLPRAKSGSLTLGTHARYQAKNGDEYKKAIERWDKHGLEPTVK